MTAAQLIRFELYLLSTNKKIELVQFLGILDIPVTEYYYNIVFGYNVRYVFQLSNSIKIHLKIDEIETYIQAYDNLITSIHDLY